MSSPPPLLSFASLLVLAGCVRVALVAWGEWQDRHLPVAYTDVDYRVYCDAAALVVAGHSPYERFTFRYTPLLAWLLTPAVLWPPFGKLLFSAADLAVAVVARAALRRMGERDEAAAVRCAALLLFNPLALTVSTRGNADVLVLLLCLACLHSLLAGRTSAAAALYGLAVHLKLYPAIYAPALLNFLLTQRGDGSPVAEEGRQRLRGEEGEVLPPLSKRWLAGWCEWLGGSVAGLRRCVRFALVSGGVWAALLGVGWWAYGWPAVSESLLYHLTRADTRHNFSLYFYPLYLQASTPAAIPPLVSLLAFLPQLALLSVIAAAYSARSLPFCLALQTAVFVCWNKVVTAQYFLWYFGLVPLVASTSSLPRSHVAAAVVLWFLAEFHWLYWAYQLEMEGRSRFLALHTAACLFFLAHCLAMGLAVAHHRQPPRLQRLRSSAAALPTAARGLAKG